MSDVKLYTLRKPLKADFYTKHTDVVKIPMAYVLFKKRLNLWDKDEAINLYRSEFDEMFVPVSVGLTEQLKKRALEESMKALKKLYVEYQPLDENIDVSIPTERYVETVVDVVVALFEGKDE